MKHKLHIAIVFMALFMIATSSQINITAAASATYVGDLRWDQPFNECLFQSGEVHEYSFYLNTSYNVLIDVSVSSPTDAACPFYADNAPNLVLKNAAGTITYQISEATKPDQIHTGLTRSLPAGRYKVLVSSSTVAYTIVIKNVGARRLFFNQSQYGSLGPISGEATYLFWLNSADAGYITLITQGRNSASAPSIELLDHNQQGIRVINYLGFSFGLNQNSIRAYLPVRDAWYRVRVRGFGDYSIVIKKR